jgi:hypothetical protein
VNRGTHRATLIPRFAPMLGEHFKLRGPEPHGGVAENEGGCVMRRIKLVVAVLAMLVVMVGGAVPALAQGWGDEHGQVDYYYNYYPG